MKAKGDTRWLSEQHDRETGRLPEVGHVGGQHRVPERECYSALDQPFEGCSAPFRIDDHAGIENQWAGGCSGSRGARWRPGDPGHPPEASMRCVLLTLPHGIDQLPYSREMVIVVFRDKIQMVHESHRHLQTRVGNGSSK
jgi:hypothetical protein